MFNVQGNLYERHKDKDKKKTKYVCTFKNKDNINHPTKEEAKCK